MAWIRRSTYHWIAIVYIALLTGQATGFSACQDKPQEIRISRGQKITVVYWVGQNALDDSAIEGKLASEIPSATGETTSSVVEETSSNTGGNTDEAITESATSQSFVDESVNFRPGEVTTEPSLQSIATETATTRVTDSHESHEIPSTALPGTSPAPLLNSNALNEGAITPEIPETSEQSFGEVAISGRNNTAVEASTLESTTPGVTPEATIAPEVDITSAQSENIDIKTASTRAEEGSTTVLDPKFRSEAEGITSEVEYWSTTPVPDVQEDDSTGTESFSLEEKSAEATTEGPRISKLDDDTEITANATAEESQVTDANNGATSGTDKTLPAEDPRIPKLDETSGPPTEASLHVTTGESEGTSTIVEDERNTSSEDPRSAKLDESASSLPTEALEEATTGESAEATTVENVTNETSAKDLSPKFLDSNITNETIAEVSIEQSTEVIGNTPEVTIAGRQIEAESTTDAENIHTTTSPGFFATEPVTESETDAESENSTQGIEGRLIEDLANDTESINSSSSSPISLDFRAAFEAETLSPIKDDTEESAEIVSDGISQPSVLEVISSTFKNLFSTLAPSTDASVDEHASPTEKPLDGRNQDVNATTEALNLESRKQDISNVTLEGREQNTNATSEITGLEGNDQDSVKETFGGRQQDSNATTDMLNIEASELNPANETILGRENNVYRSDNDTVTSSPDIVFRNTTMEGDVTIDPRSADNGTAEKLSFTTEFAEESNESLAQRSDATNETAANSSEPPIATGVIENITEVVFNSQRLITEASPGTEYEEPESQKGELDDPESRPKDTFDAPPSDIFIHIGQPGFEGDSESDGSTEEARKMGDYPMENFESFMQHNAPDLLRIPVDDSQFEKETRKREFLKPNLSKDRTKPIHVLRPSIYNGRNPFPPPYLMQFPARRSDNMPHPFSGYLIPEGASPSLYADNMQPQPSSSGPFYPSYYNMGSMVLPPESPVHYVSVMRPPDGVLPIRSLRMSPAQRGSFHQPRAKREILANATNCQWNFKSDPGVPLLLTFKSFSTPETPDCEEHYIAVERESNGFQSRWCGVSGERPGHASFARSEINLNLYSNGDGSFPTGFSIEVQALDLKLLRKYAEVRRIIKHQ